MGGQAHENTKEWEEYVSQRVRGTMGYLAGGLTVTSVLAYNLYRSPAYLRLLSSTSPMVFTIGSAVATIGSMMLVRSISPEETILKHVAWGGFNTAMAASLAPLCFMGGPLIMKAAIYTTGVVGSLSLVAMSSKSDQFLSYGPMLGMGLGVVLITSVGRIFLPAHFFIAHTLMENVVVYGGMIVFSGLVLYDTQKIVHNAKMKQQYDAMSESIGIYLDVVNLFTIILSMLNNKKKK
jgi:FtsH-binding integral membrane protein